MISKLKCRVPSRALALVCGLLLSLGAFAQSFVAKGVVKDAAGEPVIGATVRVPGAQGGAITDFDGNFQINCNQGQELEISYIGMATQKATASGNMVVTLQEDAATSLNEVVVIGYGVAKKGDLTGSVTAIKPDEKNHALVTSAQEMMQGKIAGVNITTGGGTPGGSASIRIRGGSSLNASNDPLIVIDGVAMDNQGVKGAPNALGMVNPNDIETFTVLKDASATAIYGSRGSNGVIIITTKKGRKGSPAKVSYSGNVSASAPAKYYDVLDGDEYRDFIKTYYGADSDAAKLLGTANTDWQKEIFRTAISSDHNITVQGGLKNMPYRVSVGYTDQDGILKTSNYQRTTANATINPSFLDDHLKFNVNGKFMYAHSRYANEGAISSAVRMDPTQPVVGMSHYPLSMGGQASADIMQQAYANTHGYFDWLQSGNSLGNQGYALMHNSNAPSNPVAQLYEQNKRANSFDYMGNVEADYQVHGLEALRFHMNFSADYADGTEKNDMADWGPSNFYYGNTGFTKEKKYNLIYSATAQFYKDFCETQHFDIMGGYEWSHNKYWGNDLYYDPRTSTPTTKGQSYSKNEWKQESYLVSFLGRMNYIAWEKYYLTATVRRDGSSRFFEHWATFPSVALGWKISEEKFLKNVKWIDEIKLRAGWGKTGQQDGIGNYNYFASYNVNVNNSDGRYPIPGINDEGLLYRPDAYNKNLKWETTETHNAGLDFSFFRNRVVGSVDYYYRHTTDLIYYAPICALNTFKNNVNQNIGSLDNRGVEMSLTVRPIQTKDWQWEITANATYNKNKITKLTSDSDIMYAGDNISAGTGNKCQAFAVGKPRNSFYVYQQVYDEAGKPLEGVFVDRNADGIINDSDRYLYKSIDAPWTGGFSSRLQYKNWDLGFSLRGSYGNYVFNDRQASYVNVSKRYDSSFDCLQNVTAIAIQNNWSTYDNKAVLSDYFVQNASFIKLDNITLGYSFANLFQGGNYKGLDGRLYLTATNVATITNYKGMDPEVGSGIDNSMYPRPFSLTMGVNINF